MKIVGKIIAFVTGKLFITVALLLFQVILLGAFWFNLTAYEPIANVILGILGLILVFFIVGNDDNPSFKIGWIIIIMYLPIFGGLLYLFYGNKLQLRKLANQIANQPLKFTDYEIPNEKIAAKIAKEDGRVASTIHYLQHTCKYPVYGHSENNYLPIGEVMWKSMCDELKKAEDFIFMEYFIIEDGVMWQAIYKILKQKAKAGVDVRFMYDDLGSLLTQPKNFEKQLHDDGIKCLRFNPFKASLALTINNRDHRKILVIDGEVGFTGGINLADEYINKKVIHGHWKDTGIIIKGDAVKNLTLMFLQMWNAFYPTDLEIDHYFPVNCCTKSEGYLVPFGDTPLDSELVSQSIYIDILNQAKDYVYIYTPYLIIDDQMQEALSYSAKRGVDVRIITPGVPDKKTVYKVTQSYYNRLLTAGVKIFEYTPGFTHAKSYVSDDKVAVIGTINMDYRSLYHHFECGVFLYKTPAVTQLKEDYLKTLNKCQEVTTDNFKQSTAAILFNRIIRVFAPLM